MAAERDAVRGTVALSALEIEERIRAFLPGVEFCVVGIPDPAGARAEIPVLCYVPRGGKLLTAAELQRVLGGRLEAAAIPRVVFRTAVPGGPLRRDAARAQLLATLDRTAE